METAIKTIWTGTKNHTNRDMTLTQISETVNGERFVHGEDNIGQFKALLHTHISGEEWFHGPGMQAVYMSHFHDA